jgi:exodeoxyribonuclease V alpha subunit
VAGQVLAACGPEAIKHAAVLGPVKAKPFGWPRRRGLDIGELTATFDSHSVTYGFGELDALVPAYAASIHKSQGSEYPAVIIPVMTQHYPMLQRNLLYTGVTRGKKLVVLVGQKKAVAIAIRNVSGRRRWSKLSEWLASRQSTDIDKKRTNDE